MDSYLGTAARVVYEAKSFNSNLTGIIARVIKPNNVVEGNFPLVALPDPAFVGTYYFDFFTSLSDPEGTYIGMILSPQENVRSTFKLVIFANPASGNGGLTLLSDSLLGELQEQTFIGKIDGDDPYIAFIDDLEDQFEGYIFEDDLE